MRLSTSKRSCAKYTSGKEAVASDRGLATYLGEVSRLPRIDHAHMLELSRKVLAGDMTAKKEMIEANLKLVVHVAKNYVGRGVEIVDLVSEGNFGLIRAVEKFDPDRGFRFSTYAVHWIEQSIERAVCRHSRIVRLPHAIDGKMRKVDNVVIRLSKEMGRMPTRDEVALETGFDNETIDDLDRLRSTTVSLDSFETEDGPTGMHEFIEDVNSQSVESTLANSELAAMLRDVMERLDEREKEVVRLRFGLDEEEMTLEAISIRYGLTRERIRQLQVAALRQLKKRLADYLDEDSPLEGIA